MPNELGAGDPEELCRLPLVLLRLLVNEADVTINGAA
jgi:hypothetical protein